ncbi:MAG: type II toxin-antitoxin system RelE/ParE family toxin [Polyangia bacterium]
MRILFLEPAKAELDEAVEYYEYEQPGLGEAFVSEILNALDRIGRFPDAWQSLSARTRRCRTRRFPFGVVYQKREKDILVVAVAHLHRKPQHWEDSVVSGDPVYNGGGEG